MENSLKTTRNITAIISALLIVASFIGILLDYSHSSAIVMLGIVLLITVTLPLYILSSDHLGKLRDTIIKAVEKSQKRRRRTFSHH